MSKLIKKKDFKLARPHMKSYQNILTDAKSEDEQDGTGGSKVMSERVAKNMVFQPFCSFC